MCVRIAVLALAALWLGFGFGLPNAHAQSAASHRGECDLKFDVHLDIVIVGFPCPARSDQSVVATAQGVQAIKSALDVLQTQSPRTFAVVEDLKRAGPVLITYDPNPPSREMLLNTVIGLFIPHLYQELRPPGVEKMFPVVISRDGIKWPVRELAAVLGHELMGHGKQHLEDRMDAMRTMDMECEAWLLHEQVYQDVKIDKQLPDIISFRKQLEQLQCDDFIRYMRANTPEDAKLWDTQNPDVPRLLKIFKDYIQRQQDNGMIASADAATERLMGDAQKKAEASGDPQLLFNIGQHYMMMVGTKRNPSAAADWFEKAARKGHAGAQTALARLLESGQGGKQDLDLAARLYTAAVKQGDPEALYSLGVMYETGRVVKRDARMAQMLYDKAAQFTDTRPLVVFGMLNEQGMGFKQNYSYAAELYAKAARMGDPFALYRLGILYHEGSGVSPNHAKAAKLWKHAATLNYAPAVFGLGQLYENGWGVDKDLNRARSWYNKASAMGIELATERLRAISN